MLAFANTSQQITHWDLVGHPNLMQQKRISDNFQYIYVDNYGEGSFNPVVKVVWMSRAMRTQKFELTIRLMQEIVSSGNASKKFREQWERRSHAFPPTDWTLPSCSWFLCACWCRRACRLHAFVRRRGTIGLLSEFYSTGRFLIYFEDDKSLICYSYCFVAGPAANYNRSITANQNK